MNRRQTMILLFIITGLALGLRLWRLRDMPPGLWWDEGHHNQRALDILQGGARPIYFTEADGFDPLHIYLTVLIFRLFGVHYLATRWVSVLAGALTVPALYWATVEWFAEFLGYSRARRVGLLAAFNLSVVFPHVLLSRIGFEVALVPAGTVLMLAALGRGVRTKRNNWFALSGLFLGLTLYAYPAARVIPLLIVAWTMALLLFDRPMFRRIWPGLALIPIVSLLTYLPLGIYFLRHPEWFIGRMRYVSSGALSGWRPLFTGIWETVLGIFIWGDTYPRHNLPGRAFLDPLQSVLLIIGVSILTCYICRRTRNAKYLLLLPLWLVVSLLPSALSDGAPTFTRGLGAAPPLALLIALGSESLWRIGQRKYGQWPATVVLALTLLTSTALTVNDYFIRYPAHPELFAAFQVDLWETLTEAQRAGQEGSVYLSPVSVDLFHPTIDFVLRTTPEIRPYDGRICQVLPQRTETPTTFVLFLIDDHASLARLSEIFPAGFLARQILHKPELYPFAATFYIPEGTDAHIPGVPVSIRFGGLYGEQTVTGAQDIIELVSYHYHRSDDALDVTLYWRALAPAAVNYTVFVHLYTYDAAVADEASTLVSQHDGWPCATNYPTSRWRLGEIIMDQHRLILPSTQPSPAYALYVGMYDLNTQQRLPAISVSLPVTVSDHRARIAVIE